MERMMSIGSVASVAVMARFIQRDMFLWASNGNDRRGLDIGWLCGWA